MPELPEVETIRRGLLPKTRNQLIEGVVPDDSKVFQIGREELTHRIPGQKILDLQRRGKYLLFELTYDRLVIHLGMTGQLTLRNPEEADSKRFLRHPATGLQRSRQHAPDRHTHMQIHLGNGTSIMFRDIRMFGKVYLFSRTGGGAEALLSRLGPEPLGDDYKLEAFLAAMGKRQLHIKSLLLDQRFVAGVGNIYADEALFEAGVFPGRRVRYLRKYEKCRIFEAVPVVLQKGLVAGGTSMRDYVNSDGEAGGFQEKLNVYGRAGESCYVCGAEILRIAIGQRGTHFCPTCQPR
jgi:formamidopyrimidine-DNA glycosylase